MIQQLATEYVPADRPVGAGFEQSLDHSRTPCAHKANSRTHAIGSAEGSWSTMPGCGVQSGRQCLVPAATKIVRSEQRARSQWKAVEAIKMGSDLSSSMAAPAAISTCTTSNCPAGTTNARMRTARLRSNQDGRRSELRRKLSYLVPQRSTAGAAASPPRIS